MKRYLLIAIAIHAAFTVAFIAHDAIAQGKTVKADPQDEINYLAANMVRGMKAHNALADLVIKAIIPEIQEINGRIEKLEKKLSGPTI